MELNLDFDITKIFDQNDLNLVKSLMISDIDQTSALKLVSQLKFPNTVNFYQGVPIRKIFDLKTYNSIGVMLSRGRNLDELCKDHLFPGIKKKSNENKELRGLINSKYILNGVHLKTILSRKEMNRIYNISSQHKDWTIEQIYDKFQFDKFKHSKSYKREMKLKQKISARAHMFAKRHPELDEQKVHEAYERFYETNHINKQFVWRAM